jgi:anti-sigma factor RsiW
VKNRAYNDQLLTEYLLGELPEPDREAIDQLSVTDDEMALRLQVIENDLVDAYVRGELTGSQLEQFNAHYLASPRRRDKVAFARGLQKSLDPMAIAAQETKPPRVLRESAPAQKRGVRKGILRRYLLTPRAWQWGMAAALLLLIATGAWLMVENRRLRNHINQAQAQRAELQQREQELQTQIAEQRDAVAEKEKELASLRGELARLEAQVLDSGEPPSPVAPTASNIVAFALTPQMRGGGQMATFAIPADADYIKLQSELEPNDFALYRAELKAQPGRESVWRSGKLRARADGKTITLTLRSAILKAQSYSLEIYGVSPTGASELISSYPFRVVK